MRLRLIRTGPITELGWWTKKRGYLIWPLRPLARPRFQHRPR